MIMTPRDEACGFWRKRLAAMDGWSPAALQQQAEVAHHLETCPDCRAWWRESLAERPDFWAWIGREPPLPVHIGIRTRVRHRRRRYAALAAAAAVLVGLVLVRPRILQHGSHPPLPPVMSHRPAGSSAWPLVEKVPAGASVYTLRIDRTPVVLIYTRGTEEP